MTDLDLDTLEAFWREHPSNSAHMLPEIMLGLIQRVRELERAVIHAEWHNAYVLDCPDCNTRAAVFSALKGRLGDLYE